MKITKNIHKYTIPAIAVTGITTVGVILYTFNKNGNKIINEAKKYVGIKEIHNNKGWENKHFEALMKSVGWKKPLEYCVLFVKLVLLRTFDGKKASAINKLVNASSQGTWAKLLKNRNSNIYKVTKKPRVGSIAFYRHMNKPTHGHAEIVLKVNKNSYTVISANGKVGVEIKERKYAIVNKDELRLLGFVNF